MYKILQKRSLTESVNEYVFDAPLVAKRCLPGQFVVLRVDTEGERIPITIAGYDRERGTVTLMIQSVGYTTARLARLNAGESISDLAGPLGNPTKLSGYNRILAVAGGIGSAVILPQARYLKSGADGNSAQYLKSGAVVDTAKRSERDTDGNSAQYLKSGAVVDTAKNSECGADKVVDVVLGGRNASLLTYEDELRAACDHLYLMTDDGSRGEKGFVTDKIRSLLDGGAVYDAVFAVGPMPMMRAVANLTRGYGIPTLVSMNTIMIDGSGMCGGCRLTVGGETKYACVDGPEFDGHKVDFEEAMSRAGFYREREKACRLLDENKK
jgi:ferredoxin--NADP+ reductase